MGAYVNQKKIAGVVLNNQWIFNNPPIQIAKSLKLFVDSNAVFGTTSVGNQQPADTVMVQKSDSSYVTLASLKEELIATLAINNGKVITSEWFFGKLQSIHADVVYVGYLGTGNYRFLTNDDLTNGRLNESLKKSGNSAVILKDVISTSIIGSSIGIFNGSQSLISSSITTSQDLTLKYQITKTPQFDTTAFTEDYATQFIKGGGK